MSTICFDIKRVDDDYVCIQHCDLNKFEYQYHLGFSFFPRQRNGKEHWWLTDKKYKYVWIVVGKDETGIERIVWACNDKVWLNKTIKDAYFNEFKDIRLVKLPFLHVADTIQLLNGAKLTRYETTDLDDKFKLYCPEKLNEKYHVYADCYEEIEPTVTHIDDFEFKERNFKWVPPKYLEG